MKKQISKITLKTDKIINLSKQDAQQVAGGMQPWSNISKGCTKAGYFCDTKTGPANV